jgi:cytochrome P450
MTQAPELPPLHMRRDAFSPTPELREIRETSGVRTVLNAFGMEVYLVTRHEDVKDVLSDHVRFSNGRPPGFTLPGAPEISAEARTPETCSVWIRRSTNGCGACSPGSSPSGG